MTLFTSFGWKFNNQKDIKLMSASQKRIFSISFLFTILFTKLLSQKFRVNSKFSSVNDAAKFSIQNEVPILCSGLVGSLIDNVIIGLVANMITNDNKGGSWVEF